MRSKFVNFDIVPWFEFADFDIVLQPKYAYFDVLLWLEFDSLFPPTMHHQILPPLHLNWLSRSKNIHSPRSFFGAM